MAVTIQEIAAALGTSPEVLQAIVGDGATLSKVATLRAQAKAIRAKADVVRQEAEAEAAALETQAAEIESGISGK